MNNFALPHTVKMIVANHENKVSIRYTADYLVEVVGMEYQTKSDFIREALIPALAEINNAYNHEVLAYASKVMTKIIN